MNNDPSKIYTSSDGREYKVIGIEKVSYPVSWVICRKFLDNSQTDKVKL
jgi:hypothetical protein